jgi:hypothetical protein
MAATYRIGPSDFFLPGDLKADAELLNSQVDALDASIDPLQASDTFRDGWEVFRRRWKDFFDDHFGGYLSSVWASLNNSNRDELISFERQFVSWSTEAKQQGIDPPGPTIEPSTGTADTFGAHLNQQIKDAGLPDLSTLLIGAAIIVGLVVAWKVSK